MTQATTPRAAPDATTTTVRATTTVERGEDRVNEAAPAQARITEHLGLHQLPEGQHWIAIAERGKTKAGGRYYGDSTLRQAATDDVFGGVPIHLGHADKQAEARRGHRDLSEWVGNVVPGTSQYLDVEGLLVGAASCHDPRGARVFESVIARDSCGISHDSTMTWKQAIVNGEDLLSIQQIKRSYGVDIVPRANAGGRILESEPTEEGDNPMENQELLVILSDLREKIDALQANRTAEAAPPPAPEPVPEQKDTEARAQLDALRKELRRRDMRELVTTRVAEAEGLTPTMRGRVIEAVCAGDTELDKIGERVTEAIESEKNYAAALLRETGGGTRVRLNGGTVGSGRTQEAYDASLKSFAARHGLVLDEGSE
jgi:hypothetical protein